MKHRFVAMIAALCVLTASGRVLAGQFNSVLSVGDPAPPWVDLPGVDGKKHSLADLTDKDVVVIVFTCNSCPIATDYEDRIIAFAKTYTGSNKQAALVAINVNKVEEDSLPKMKERALSKSFPYPYLYDASQKIAKAYGALFTPEFFVLDKGRKVTYMGAFDDNIESTKVKRQFVAPAVEATLKGQRPNPAETIAHGCLIRYDRPRRRRAAS